MAGNPELVTNTHNRWLAAMENSAQRMPNDEIIGDEATTMMLGYLGQVSIDAVEYAVYDKDRRNYEATHEVVKPDTAPLKYVGGCASVTHQIR